VAPFACTTGHWTEEIPKQHSLSPLSDKYAIVSDVTSHVSVPAIRAVTAHPLVVRRYVDFQRTCSATCR